MCREALTLALFIGIAFELSAAEPIRLDRFGDPLPEGAIFRLGTTRFRPAGGGYEFAVSPDAKTFATAEYGEPCRVRLWDATTGKVLWMNKLRGDGGCNRLVFSPDAKRLMVIGWQRDNSPATYCYPMFLFDTISGKIIDGMAPSKGYGSTDRWQFLLDGKYFLTQVRIEKKENVIPAGHDGAAADETVPIVWDLETGKETHRFPASTDLTVSSDKRTVAIAIGGSIRVWDAESQKIVTEFRSDKAKFESLTFSADGSTLAAIRSTPKQANDTITIDKPETREDLVFWDIATCKELHVWTTDNSYFVLSRNGRFVAALDWRSRIQVREVKTGKVFQGAWQFDNGLSPLFPETNGWHRNHMLFASDGTLLVRDQFHGFRQFDPETGRCLRRMPEDQSYRCQFDLVDDGKTLVTSHPSISFRDIATEKDRADLGQHRGPIWDLLLSKSGNILVSRGYGPGLRVWDMATGMAQPTPLAKGCSTAICCFGFLEEDKAIVAVGEDAVVRVWEARTGKIIREFGIADFATRWDWATHRSDTTHNKESWLSLSSDKRTVAIAGRDRISAWDVSSGQRIAQFSGWEDAIERIQLAGDGRSILIHTSKNSVVRSIDGQHQIALNCEEPEIVGLRRNVDRDGYTSFSADGKWFACVSPKSIIVYEVCKCKQIWSIPRQTNVENSLPSDFENWCEFTADSRHLAAISHDETIVLYDVATGKESRKVMRPPDGDDPWNEIHNPFRGQTAGIPDIDRTLCAFRLYAAQQGRLPPELHSDPRYITSRDNRLFGYCREENITLVESRTGKKIATFQSAPIGNVGCVLFGADSRMLITGSNNSSILVWDWPTAAKLKPDAPLRPDSSTWNDLASDDAGNAYRAIFTMVAQPNEALSLLRASLKPATKEEMDRARTWIAELDHDRFAVRDSAKKSLQRMGGDALPVLQDTLKRRLTAEGEKSVRGLIALASGTTSAEINRQIRAIQALEWMNTIESRRLLTELANGEPGATRTKEAAKSLAQVRAK